MPSIETCPAAVAVATTEARAKASQLPGLADTFAESYNLLPYNPPVTSAHTVGIAPLWCLSYDVLILALGFQVA